MTQNMSSEQTLVRRRAYKGNPNYIQLYNAHCNNFNVAPELFQTYMPHIDRPSSLGTAWSKKAKTSFFELLGRYSIHNVDLIAKSLQRSEEDVLNYYNKLKRQLTHLKKNKRRFHRLLRMDEMPIAYEMSQSFVDMENEQARCLAAFERMKAGDRFYEHKIKATEEDLLDMEATRKLLDLYNTPLLDNARLRTRIVSDLYQFLNQFIIIMTKKIILDIITKKLTKVPKKYPYKAKQFRNFNQGVLSFKIATPEIKRSVQKFYPKGPHRLANYWSDYKRRSVPRSRRKAAKKVAIKKENNDEEQRSVSNSSSSVSGDSDLSLSESDFDSDADTPIKNENDLRSIPIREVNRVPRWKARALKAEFRSESGNFIDDESESLIDNEVAEEIFMRESAYLNDKDLVDSRHHEHILLTFLTTANAVQLKTNNKTIEMYRVQTPPVVKDCYEEGDNESGEELPEEIDPALALINVDSGEEGQEEVNSDMITMHLYDYATY